MANKVVSGISLLVLYKHAVCQSFFENYDTLVLRSHIYSSSFQSLAVWVFPAIYSHPPLFPSAFSYDPSSLIILVFIFFSYHRLLFPILCQFLLTLSPNVSCLLPNTFLEGFSSFQSFLVIPTCSYHLASLYIFCGPVCSLFVLCSFSFCLCVNSLVHDIAH